MVEAIRLAHGKQTSQSVRSGGIDLLPTILVLHQKTDHLFGNPQINTTLTFLTRSKTKTKLMQTTSTTSSISEIGILINHQVQKKRTTV